MNAVAVDDEPIALEVIKAHAAKVPFLQLDAVFTDAFLALEHLAKNRVSLLFLDIKMPDISGIDLMQSLQQKPMVIFTTAYSEHAVQSYELDAVDYLLKPFSFPRFLKACQKAYEQHHGKQGVIKAVQSVFIKSGYEQVKVDFDDILFLESAGNYMTFILENDRRILSRLTMTETLEILPQNQFIRTHRSYIVNKEKVNRIERHQVHIGNEAVPLGEAYGRNLI